LKKLLLILIALVSILVCGFVFKSTQASATTSNIEIVYADKETPDVEQLQATINHLHEWNDYYKAIYEYNDERERDKQFRQKIIKRFEQIAYDENVNVYYVPYSFMEDVSKTYNWEFVAGGLHWGDSIYVCIDYADYFGILAHELGHHFAITYENDHSEQRACEIGRDLILTGEYKH
jgi:hypothetical protein